ncbi:hypothetical protein MNBD_GAMMA01-244 [hydrothermal vent metagenome]|uniref:Uncharacterized protein n=1 Tax=hydrothermal vent metagenome TaxID=652676 RepID=A0A3B0VQW7_9ZZZZ
MFTLIDDWYVSKLFKKEFLIDKDVSQGKFDYWLKKYHHPNRHSKKVSAVLKTEDFKEVTLSSVSESARVSNDSVKIIEFTTPSGFELKIYERC